MFEFFDAGESEEELSGKGPAWGVVDVVLEEGVGFVEISVQEGEAEGFGEELAGGSFAASDRADDGDLPAGRHGLMGHNLVYNKYLWCEGV